LATYVIGDIHGRTEPLQRLLATISPGKGDFVVFLGDYIDRGPDSRGVVETLIQYRDASHANVRFLKGNHEAAMLCSLNDPCRHTWIVGMEGLATVRSYSESVASQFDSTMSDLGPALFEQRLPLPYDNLVRAMPDSHIAFLRGLLPYFRSPDVVCVHAGVSASYRGVESEVEESLLWGVRDWWRDYRSGDTIAYGHWGNAIDSSGVASPFICNGSYGLDCSGADDLLAVRFPDIQVVRASDSADRSA
jgi:serine/threonine protein phosphatase 1